MKKAFIPLLLCLCLILSSCGGTPAAQEEAKTLGFSDAVSFDTIKALDGKRVMITGYMATNSPVSGEFIYLMNMPYQSCPFCVPNTLQLSNTMAVYAPSGHTFTYTEQPIRVTGTIKVEDYEDRFGYTYNYRIVDASYETVDLSSVSEEYGLWQSVAADGIANEVNNLMDFLYFVCQWNTYYVEYTDDNGEYVFYYLWPGDAQEFLVNDYPDKLEENYYTDLIAKIHAISPDKLEDLVSILEKAQKLQAYAIEQLYDESQYVFNEEDETFSLLTSDDLYNQWSALYSEFSLWMGRWQI